MKQFWEDFVFFLFPPTFFLLAQRYSFVEMRQIVERYKTLPKTAEEIYLIEKIRGKREGKQPEA